MSAFYPLGSDSLSTDGRQLYQLVAFTDDASGGSVAGSYLNSESDRWVTDHFPIIWTVVGGSLGGGKAYYPTRIYPEGGSVAGGKARTPLRIATPGGGISGGQFVPANFVYGDGGGLVGGSAIQGYYFGILTSGGAVVGNTDPIPQEFFLHSEIMLLSTTVTMNDLIRTETNKRFIRNEV